MSLPIGNDIHFKCDKCNNTKEIKNDNAILTLENDWYCRIGFLMCKECYDIENEP